MNSNKRAIIALVSIAILGILDRVGGRLDLYYIFPWYDILTHFVAGFAVAMVVLWLSRKSISFLIIVSLVIAIGAGWELFEYIFKISLLPGEIYRFDTSMDIAMDALGAVLAIIISKKIK